MPHHELIHDHAALAQVAHRQIHERLGQIDPIGTAQGHSRADLGVGAAVSLVLLTDAQHTIEQRDHRTGRDQVVDGGGKDERVRLLHGGGEPGHIVVPDYAQAVASGGQAAHTGLAADAVAQLQILETDDLQFRPADLLGCGPGRF